MSVPREKSCKLPGWLGVLWLASAGVLACGDASREGPRLDEVSPARVFFGVPERLVLRGAFMPALAVDLGADTPPTLENRFEIHIGPQRAYSVRVLTQETLEATAPATLPPGSYDVTVTNERGQSTTLPGAFEVVDRTIHRLVFVTSMRSAYPDAWTEAIRIELRDDQGQAIPTSARRHLRVTSESATGHFARLGDDRADPMLELTLEPGESGLDFLYRDSTPGYHTLESSTMGLPPISQPVAVGRLGPPAAVRFSRKPTAPLLAGEPIPLTVEVVDASGGPASFPPQGIRLELSTDSPAGGVALNEGEAYQPVLLLTLDGTQGRLPFLYRDTRSAAEVKITARAVHLGTLTPLQPDEVSIAVRPGPASRFEVQRVSTGPFQVGTPQAFVVRALDTYGNLASTSGPVLLSTFPEDPGFSPATATLEGGRATFDAQFTRTQTVAVVASLPNSANVRGASSELVVRPGPAVRLTLSPVAGLQRAGAPFNLALRVLDQFGNRVDTPHSFTLSASGVPAGALSPTDSGPFEGELTLTLSLTAAVAETRLTVTSPTLSATSNGFAVLAGPTQRFVVEDTPGAKTAGIPFTLRIRALDAFGNMSQDLHDVDLSAEGVAASRLSPTQVVGFRGQADVSVVLTQSLSNTRLSVISGAAKGQQAGLFAVDPGPFAGYAMTVPSCIEDKQRWKLTVTAVDDWGNLVPTYTRSALLVLSPFGRIVPTSTPGFSGGSVTIPNAYVEGASGQEPYPCLELIAEDTSNAAKNGTACLNLQQNCP
jgi:hypothetical protein